MKIAAAVASTLITIGVLVALFWSENKTVVAQSATESVSYASPFAPPDPSESEPESGAILPGKSTEVAHDDGDPLFQDVDESMLNRGVVDAGKTFYRHRVVTIDVDYLRAKIRDERDETPLLIQVLPGTVIPTIASLKAEYASGPRVGFAIWRGTVLGDPKATTVVLVASPDGSVVGHMTSSSGWFRIFPTEQPPYHFITQAEPGLEVNLHGDQGERDGSD